MDKNYKVAIRRQDKSVWERRAPLCPAHVKEILTKQQNITIYVQPCKKRIFSDQQYKRKGAIIQEDISQCDLIVGIKEVPVQKFIDDKTFMFFSHTIKAQPHNMGALDKMLQKRIRLIDYEKITDQKNNRLIAFGKYAGIAGAIDFLKGLGQYLMQMGIGTPLLNVNCAYKYFQLKQAYEHFKGIGKKLVEKRIPKQIAPLIFGITGRGRTAHGVLQVLQNFPITAITPEEVQKIYEDKDNPDHLKTIYVVNINSEDVMTPLDSEAKFDKQEYYKQPEKYKSVFNIKFLPYLSALFHCIFWSPNCPRYIENKDLKQLAQQKKLRLLGICDVSCDLEGSIECLKAFTVPEKPFFWYDSLKQKQTFQNTYQYGKILYLAIDFLPSQLAFDSSMHFSNLLKDWIPTIVKSNPKAPIQQQQLPSQLKRAVITLNGKLTPNFQFIAKLRQKNQMQMNSMVKKEQVNKTETGQMTSMFNPNITIVSKEKIKPQVLNFDDDN